MKKVAKLVIVDKDEKYLLMYRSNHPTFGNDPDLPGGTVEEGESLELAMATFEKLMGNDVAPRKEFIVAGAYALDAERIDA